MSQDPVLCYVQGEWAWFTTAPLDRQWGDDWNDVPYEHNAGDPYAWREGGEIEKYELTEVAWKGPWETPADVADGNSRYSVEMINAGKVAWLLPDRFTTKCPPHIFAGTTLSQFRRIVTENGGKVYEVRS